MERSFEHSIQIRSGKRFWPLDPRVEEIDIHDIAHALSNICRFTGHCLKFYSVAEHSVYISMFCPPEYALWGLLHDASEAYLVDVPRPIKPLLLNYKAAEDRLMELICEKFDLQKEMPDCIKQLDYDIIGNERDQIMAPPLVPWGNQSSGIPGLVIQCWSPEEARDLFIRRFWELYHGYDIDWVTKHSFGNTSVNIDPVDVKLNRQVDSWDLWTSDN
jgi:hypothetical protein